MSQLLSVGKTFIFWGMEVAGAVVGTVIGSIFGRADIGFIAGLVVGGLTYIALNSRLTEPTVSQMETDEISEISIDESGSLHVIPMRQEFPYIYREAMEVHWSEARRSLYSPRPREWTYAQWYARILAAALEQGCMLRLVDETRWSNIPESLRAEITGEPGGVA